MAASDLTTEVQGALDVDLDAFGERVREEARWVKEELAAGTFDNPQAIVGLEYEFYGVSDADYSLRRVPRPLLDLVGFEKELGLHNAEIQTSPQPLSAYGLDAQHAELIARVDAAMDATTRSEDIRLVSDGLWTVPPRGEDAETYLTASGSRNGVRIATNVSDSPRYQAMQNSDYHPQCRLDAPHVSLETNVVAPESLITSIQPHYQIPTADDLPTYFRYALRIAAPLLAMGVNSPFFPPSLYDDDASAGDILADCRMENRIHVFQDVMNPRDADLEKVTFPRDIDTIEEAIDRIAHDRPVVPTLVEGSGRFDDNFAHLRHKHGTYWRWVRPVLDGASRSDANVRIEFRPIPGQPTIRDSIAVLATFTGLLKSLPHREHPVTNLDWGTAESNFYAAVRDGLDADLTWITGDGDRVQHRDVIYADLFEHARDGLELRGFTPDQADQYLRPLRRRADTGITPARWKHRQVRNRLDDGASLTDAIHGMQRAYITRQRDTFVDGSFGTWLSAAENV